MLYKMEDSYRQKGEGVRKLYWAKKRVGYCHVAFLQGMAEVCQEDYLASDNQVIPDWHMIPLVVELKL